MKSIQSKNITPVNSNHLPFFRKENDNNFFGKKSKPTPFFNSNFIQTKLTVGQPNDIYEKEADAVADKVVQNENKPMPSIQNESAVQTKPAPGLIPTAPLVQTKCASCEKEEGTVQRQEEPDESVTKTDTPDPNNTPATTPTPGFGRAGKCKTTPEFPNFGCLTQALKLDIDDNLWSNAHQFYRVASLYPGDNDLMWNTFLRYGLGVNLLQTGFGFMGANKTLATVLSYGTGVGLKSYDFFKNGKLELDIPIPLGKGLNLDLKLDLNADPKNLGDIKGVDTGVGISGHF